jgi:multiple antibiotic resistance protein
LLSIVIHSFAAFFAIMNPFGNLPIFMTLTSDRDIGEQRRIAQKSVVISFILLTVFLLLGSYILNFFGITINAFRITGGILIFGIAYHLLHAKTGHSQSLHQGETDESKEKEDVSVTPLATPILAGPGTIATVMALSVGQSPFVIIPAEMIAYTLVLALIYIVFRYANVISRHLGTTELNVITRLMGLILAIIAVQMAVTGLKGLFPVLSLTTLLK